jgi:hypothetical protein
MVALAAACMALGVTSSPAQVPPTHSPAEAPNDNLVREPPPPALSGLWALGHRCGVRKGWLRITATTLTVADEPPVGYDYIPEVPHHLESSLTPKNSNHDYTYSLEDHTLTPDAEDSDPDRIYYACFGANPGWPPRTLEHPDAVFDRLMARLVRATPSEDDSAELSRFYFIKGEAAFRQLARLLNAGRRAEVRARFQQFEQEMAIHIPRHIVNWETDMDLVPPGGWPVFDRRPPARPPGRSAAPAVRR